MSSSCLSKQPEDDSGRESAVDIATWLDKDYFRNIEELKAEFAATVNIKDDQSLTAWFANHIYLNDNEHSLAAGVANRVIRRWRHRLGFKDRSIKSKPPGYHPAPVIATETPPENWRHNYDWLQMMYDKYKSTVPIARLVNLTVQAVCFYLKRVGVQTMPKGVRDAPKHKCYDRSWLLRHYVVKRLSVEACAKCAKVSTYTMWKWLKRMGFRIRSASEHGAAAHAASMGKEVRIKAKSAKRHYRISQGVVEPPSGGIQNGTD